MKEGRTDQEVLELLYSEAGRGPWTDRRSQRPHEHKDTGSIYTGKNDKVKMVTIAIPVTLITYSLGGQTL